MVKTSASSKTAPEITSAVAGSVIGGGVLIIAIVAVFAFRTHAAVAAKVTVPPAVVQQDQQFLASLEGMSADQRQSYLGQNMEQWDEFRMTANPTQMAEFAKCMSGH